MKILGQIAYETFVRGIHHLPWEDLDLQEQEAWKEVAAAVLKEATRADPPEPAPQSTIRPAQREYLWKDGVLRPLHKE